MPAETFVTLLTPVGRGALATIAIEGPAATPLVERLFRPAFPRPLQRTPLAQIVFGHWHHGDGRVEEVVVCRHTDTWVELHCHGGRAAAESMIASLVAMGAHPCDQSAWARRHATGRIEAAARIALTEASTERVAAVLLDQYRGALRRSLLEVREQVEAGGADTRVRQLTRLAELAPLGRHLTCPWRVVCAGAPNVGKSSLINAMLGFERSIVFDQPGTTRDLIVAQTALDGWPVELSDTAGLRVATNQIEIEGVARAQEELAAADLVLLVFDASDTWLPCHQARLDRWPGALIVANKSDLIQGPPSSMAAWGQGREALLTSALVGTGIGQLIQAIAARLVPDAPAPREAVPFTPEQCDAVQRAQSLQARGEVAAATALLSKLL